MLAALLDAPKPIDQNPLKITRLPKPAPADGVVEIETAGG